MDECSHINVIKNACPRCASEVIEGLCAEIERAKTESTAACDAHMETVRRAEAAEAQLAVAVGVLEGTLGLIQKAQERIWAYLEPTGDNDPKNAISDLIYLFDGPEQRAIEKPARAALSTLPTRAKLLLDVVTAVENHVAKWRHTGKVDDLAYALAAYYGTVRKES